MNETSGARPQGWASLTRLHRHGPAAADPFPSLPSHSTRLGAAGHADASSPNIRRTPHVAAPFASVITKGSHQQVPPGASVHQPNSLQDILGRLSEHHGWADEHFIQDVLRAVDGDEDIASAQLYSMAPPYLPQDSRAEGVEAVSQRPVLAVTAPQGVDSSVADGPGFVDLSLDGAGVNGPTTEPVEREQENDVYLKFRREALRKSRARDRYARGAYNAFVAGDHGLAKQLSREARENWRKAEKLHAQAAEEILLARNSDGQADIWSLDLHGLHAMEAVMALHQRLTYLEDELAKNPALIYGDTQREPDRLSEVQGERYAKAQEQLSLLAAPRALVKKELSVITGVGRHSKGGPSLPSAVKNFLLTNGYKINDARPGVVAVTPKRHYI